MNKKNYKQNLRKSFILCGIMLAIILLIFVFATNVNNNVAENMVGRMLYISVENGCNKAYMYDFDNKIKTEFEQFEEYGDIQKMQFINDDTIAFVCTKDEEAGVYVFSPDGQVEKLYNVENVKEIISFDCDGEKLLVAYENMDENACVFSLTQSGDVTEYMSCEDKKVTGACFSYDKKEVYISILADNTILYSSKVTGSTLNAQYTIEKNDSAVVSAYKNGFFIQHESDVARYISAKEYESTLEFCEDDYKYYSLCAITDSKFIVASDINGNMDIFVCNGSNMDPVDAVNDESANIPMDYLQTK